jgi:O-antigen ligase
MKQQEAAGKWLTTALLILYAVLLISVIFSLRAVTSITLGTILVVTVAKNKSEEGKTWNRNLRDPFIVCCFIFFLIQLTGLLYTNDIHKAWSNLKIKSLLIAIPLCLAGSDFITEETRRKLMNPFCIAVFFAVLYCLGAAIYEFSITYDSSVFFYHQLVQPFSQHAILFSVLVFISLLYLLENLGKRSIHQKGVAILLAVVFTIFLLLLSSKLVIGLYLLYLVFYVILMIRQKKLRKTMLGLIIVSFTAAITLIIFTDNRIRERFSDLMRGHTQLAKRNEFSPGIYFNGVQFRLLHWRFVPEILDEQDAWLKGVSVGDAQHLIDQKYISSNMYVGEAYRHDKGFLGYNAHNEFLQSLLQSGIIGLLSFIAICVCMVRLAIKKKNIELGFTVALLLALSFTESVFETQHFLFVFLFFPLFFYLPAPAQKILS